MNALPQGCLLRSYAPTDAGAVAELYNRFEQEPSTDETIRQRFEQFPPMLPVQRWVVEQQGRVIAYGQAAALHEPGSEHPMVFFLRAEVDEAHQGQGIGRHLIAQAEAFALENDAQWLMTKVRDDLERSRRFLELQGYRQEQHLYGVILDLKGFEASFSVPEGVEIRSWDTFPDDAEHRRLLYECYIAADADTPGIELWGLIGYDDWLHSIFESSWFRPQGVLVAVDEQGEWVGLTIAGPTDAHNVSTDFTGVRRSHRGRGIARALKIAGAQWAKSTGAKHLHTFNDDRNESMRHINFALGFKPQTGWRMMRKDP